MIFRLNNLNIFIFEEETEFNDVIHHRTYPDEQDSFELLISNEVDVEELVGPYIRLSLAGLADKIIVKNEGQCIGSQS